MRRYLQRLLFFDPLGFQIFEAVPAFFDVPITGEASRTVFQKAETK